MLHLHVDVNEVRVKATSHPWYSLCDDRVPRAFPLLRGDRPVHLEIVALRGQEQANNVVRPAERRDTVHNP